MFDLLQQAVDSAIASGAKYSDARILSSKSRSIQARNGDIEDFNEADGVFSTLMGDDVTPRRDFIQTNALDVQNLDI